MAAGDRGRWDARWAAAASPEVAEPSGFLRSLDDLLPRAGRALDVAGGAGRNALWLARRGLAVTLVDVSPVALERAHLVATAAGLGLELLAHDLDDGALPSGPFALVLSLDFLSRPLFAAFPAALGPDGLLVYAQPTTRNLERHAHPSARFLLGEGELPALVRDLEVLRYEEGWFDDRHEARLVARKHGTR